MPKYLFAFLTMAAAAADIEIRVSGIASASGEIGCALYSSKTGFPMDSSPARTQWLPADPKGVTCRFGNAPAGRYAVAVSHDLNGNRKTDTGLFGIPKEAWGVSNNVRPRMRAPKFEEAVFEVEEGRDMTLEIQVAR